MKSFISDAATGRDTQMVVESSLAEKMPNKATTKRKVDDSEEDSVGADNIDETDVDEADDEEAHDDEDYVDNGIADVANVDAEDIHMGDDGSEDGVEDGLDSMASESESESGSEEDSRGSGGFVEPDDEEVEKLAALSSPPKNGARLTNNVSADIVRPSFCSKAPSTGYGRRQGTHARR